jgi:hypothetical protein
VDGELEDILDCLFLLLVDLLAVLGRVLLYSIALSLCGVAVALHLCMASISLRCTCQLDVVTSYLELSSRCLQPCFCQTFVERETEQGEQRANLRAMSKDTIKGKNEYNTRSYMLHELSSECAMAQIFV